MSAAARQPDGPSARAHALLKLVLSSDEYAQITLSGYLEIASPNEPNRTYRIPRGPGFVRLFEYGVAIADLCVQPIESLPPDDVVVMHKLMIEANEREYLATANRFTVFPSLLATLPHDFAPMAPPAPPPLDLRRADLRHVQLHTLNLRRADLQGRDLSGMNLSGLDLSEANLRGANLAQANLTRTCLRGANLRDATLSGATLVGADLQRARLQ